eukprot:2083075-Amphidinium_carterae.1
MPGRSNARRFTSGCFAHAPGLKKDTWTRNKEAQGASQQNQLCDCCSCREVGFPDHKLQPRPEQCLNLVAQQNI